MFLFLTGEGDENDENITEKNSKTEIWEDIYGRQRDSQGGVVQSKYVPPALRAAKSSNDTARLEKQLKGRVNTVVELKKNFNFSTLDKYQNRPKTKNTSPNFGYMM